MPAASQFHKACSGLKVPLADTNALSAVMLVACQAEGRTGDDCTCEHAAVYRQPCMQFTVVCSTANRCCGVAAAQHHSQECPCASCRPLIHAEHSWPTCMRAVLLLAPVCVAGREGADCSVCAVGQYSEGGPANETLLCTPCPPGTWTKSAGSTSADACACELIWRQGYVGGAWHAESL